MSDATGSLEVAATMQISERIVLILGFGVAAAMFGLRIVGSNMPLSVSLPGAVAFGAVVAVPSVLALLAGRGRAGLYLGAGVTSIVLSLGLSLLIVVMLPLGVFWLWSYMSAHPGHLLRSVTAGLAGTLLVVGAFIVLFVHVDARCTNTYADGRVEQVAAGSTGLRSGWAWDVGGTSSSSMTAGPDVVAQACVSDVVTWVEAVVSMALIGAAVASARAIAAPDTGDRVSSVPPGARMDERSEPGG